MRWCPRGDGNRRPLVVLNLPSRISFTRFITHLRRDARVLPLPQTKTRAEFYAEEASILDRMGKGAEAGLSCSSCGERVKPGTSGRTSPLSSILILLLLLAIVVLQARDCPARTIEVSLQFRSFSRGYFPVGLCLYRVTPNFDLLSGKPSRLASGKLSAPHALFDSHFLVYLPRTNDRRLLRRGLRLGLLRKPCAVASGNEA